MLIRPILAIAAIALPIWFAAGHVAHHEGDNPFLLLHAHLNAEPLIYGADAHDAHDGGDEHAEEEAAHGHSHGDEDEHADESAEEHAAHAHGDDHAGETAEEHAAHAHGDDHAGETAEEHAAHAHGDDHAGETAEEHAAHAADDEHAGNDYVFAVALPASLSFFDGRTEQEKMDPLNPPLLVMTNLQLFQLAAAALLFICLLGVPKYLRTGKGDRMSRVFAGFCAWIRDEMVYPVMGRETGKRFLPLFLIMFFFILFMNMLGLVPGSATATASIFVTCALAVVTLVAMLGCGMAAQGPIAFWKHLVPHVPAALWPLMFVVEVVGLIVKPFALTVRLFANMSGGHLVVLSFMGLIFYFTQQFGDGVGWASAPVALGFAVFIMIIEFFVAMLQAYVFTQLSILFVQASVHPDH
jgi:F-type H+-transporting ATPase subunit a